MKYLDEVGHLGGMDDRTTVDLGVARVFVEQTGDLWFEGRDRLGKPWRAWIAQQGGVGATGVWTADFDRNGQQDLLIAARNPKNGRCIDGADIYTLMFDVSGRPVPWRTHSFSFEKYEHPPVPILANAQSRAELVAVSCEYANPSDTGRLAEDRRISGIYEATGAHWRPIRNAPESRYLGAAKSQIGRRASGDERWLETDPATWPDFQAGRDRPATEQITSLLQADAGCRSRVLWFPIEDGRVVRNTENPCKVIGHDRIVYSDGVTRMGWPSVVIDSPEGRDVYLSDPQAILKEVAGKKYRFKILGDDASPSLLWVNVEAAERH